MSGSCGRRKKKKKKIRRAHILLPPYSSLSVSTLCLYISKFDIDSPPGIGQTLFLVWRGGKNVISRMNNLTSTLFFRLLPSLALPSPILPARYRMYRIYRGWKFGDSLLERFSTSGPSAKTRVNFHRLAAGHGLKTEKGKKVSPLPFDD